MPRALVHDQTMTGAAIPAPGLLGDLGLRGAAIIVTGASSGIGAATATALAAAGANVVLVGRREDALKAQADVVAEAGAEALAVPADMAEPGSPARIAAGTDHTGSQARGPAPGGAVAAVGCGRGRSRLARRTATESDIPSSSPGGPALLMRRS